MVCVAAGCTCSLTLWTDGQHSYIDVADAGAVAGRKRNLRECKANQIIAHIKGGHSHPLLPDVSLISNLPQARSVPSVARESILDMRRGGMSMKNIFISIKVGQCF